jgi:hypothetical protein
MLFTLAIFLFVMWAVGVFSGAQVELWIPLAILLGAVALVGTVARTIGRRAAARS